MKTFEIETIETIQVTQKKIYTLIVDNETTIDDVTDLVEQGNVCQTTAVLLEEVESEPTNLKITSACCVEQRDVDNQKRDEAETALEEAAELKSGVVGRF
jgi:hypothetical protein